MIKPSVITVTETGVFHTEELGNMKNNKGIRGKELLRSTLIEFMVKNDLWEEQLKDDIPTSFENYGGLILFRSPSLSHSKWEEAGDELWRLLCTLTKGDRIAIKGPIRDDGFRTPQMRLVFGKCPVATFIDNGIKYQWNIERTMFSRGNVSERHRIARLDCSNEVVVDLYAGIGYFTLPFLVKANAKHVHACEWNPDALESLRRNLQLNNVSQKCTIHEGDNRLVCPRKVADRVILGLIPSSEESWETACQALLPSGGILYVHQNVDSNLQRSGSPSMCQDCSRLRDTLPPLQRNQVLPAQSVYKTRDELLVMSSSNEHKVTWKWPEWCTFSLHLSHVLLIFLESYHGGPWIVCVSDVFKVKSYAPHIDHLVLEVRCNPP